MYIIILFFVHRLALRPPPATAPRIARCLSLTFLFYSDFVGDLAGASLYAYVLSPAVYTIALFMKSSSLSFSLCEYQQRMIKIYYSGVKIHTNYIIHFANK